MAKQSSGNLGGARPGAGRKPKADKYRADINRLEKQIRDKLPDLMEAMIGLALGVLVENPDPEDDSKPAVYKTKPDRQALEYCINRIAGKPTERAEIDMAGGLELGVKGYVGVSPDDWDDPTSAPPALPPPV